MGFQGTHKRNNEIGVPKKKPNQNYIGKMIALVGYSVRAINLSAKAASFKTLAIDCFADKDLQQLSDRFIFVNLEKYKNLDGKLDNPSAYYLYKTIEKNKRKILDCDYFVLGSAFENHPEILKKIEKYDNYIGSSHYSIQKIRSADLLYTFLIKEGIKFPKSLVFSKDEEKDQIDFLIYGNNLLKNPEVQHIKYSKDNLFSFFKDIIEMNFSLPCILKPEKSGGGFGIYYVRNENDFNQSIQNIKEIKEGKFIIQEYISGKQMSCSFISNGKKVKILSIFEQIIGDHKFGCKNDFAYCGNILNRNISDPKSYENTEITKELDKILHKIVHYSGLKGSNGMDFILRRNENESITNNIIFMEINARFQGTIDLFEKATGLNVMEMHLRSILEPGYNVPEIKFPDAKTYIKGIFYSPIDLQITADLTKLNFLDVPLIGEQTFLGQPLCSTIAMGNNKEETFKKILKNRDLIIKELGIRSRIPSESEFLK
ncbi:MAG: ATP-grasp domain-containing protein [Promethearchaeota archaeon]